MANSSTPSLFQGGIRHIDGTLQTTAPANDPAVVTNVLQQIKNFGLLPGTLIDVGTF